MKKIFYTIIVSSLLFYSCGVTLDETELADLAFTPANGIIAGTSIGDNWDKIKTTRNPKWNLREETTKQGDKISQYRKDWDIASDYMYINFDVDDRQNIRKITLKLQGTGAENSLVVRKFTDKVIARINAIPGIEMVDGNAWRLKSESGTIQLRFRYDKQEEESNLHVYIEPEK